MTRKSFVLELGSGADLAGGETTKAAVKAVKDAIYDGSLFVLEYVDSLKVLVDVTIGVPVNSGLVRVEWKFCGVARREENHPRNRRRNGCSLPRW